MALQGGSSGTVVGGANVGRAAKSDEALRLANALDDAPETRGLGQSRGRRASY